MAAVLVHALLLVALPHLPPLAPQRVVDVVPPVHHNAKHHSLKRMCH